MKLRKSLLSLFLAVAVALIAVPASAVVLDGNYLRVGVSNSGGLIDDAFTVGIDYDKNGTGTWTGWDFLKPGTPYEFHSIGYGGGTWNAAGYYHGNSFSATSVNTSAGTTNSAVTTGTYGPLSIAQTLSYADSSGFIDFYVRLTNTSGAAVTDVVYARGLDPDQDVYAGGGYPTTNVISSGDLVYAAAPITDWTIGIYSNSAYPHVPTINSGWDSDPYSLLTPRDDGYGDWTINMAFDIGTLDPGQYADIYFQYRIAETHGGVTPIPEPCTMILFGTGIAGAAGFLRKMNKKS